MERWDLYDDDGHPTGRQALRGNALPPKTRHLAAELWLADAQGHLLLQRRSPDKVILPDVWAMTTGCMVAGEDSRAGILREAHEELGVTLEPARLHLLRRVLRPGESLIWDVYAARLEVVAPALCLQAEEVADARWVEVEELRRLIEERAIFVYPEINELLVAVEAWLAG